MRRIWVGRELDAPAPAVWALLVDTGRWSDWGPSVVDARVDEPLRSGTTGVVTTIARVTLPFRITTFVPGVEWAWTVAGVPATDHRVRPLDDDRCRVEFGVAWPAAPYLAVCKMALARLAELVDTGVRT